MIINISNKPNIYGQVGRRVEYTGDMANPAGVGAIVAINEPTKHGPLSADIILEDGRILTAVYCNTIVHISEAKGCRHRVLALDDEFATEEEIAGLHAKRALKIAADKARQEAANQAFAAEVERLKAEYPDLVAGDDRKAAATNTRSDQSPLPSACENYLLIQQGNQHEPPFVNEWSRGGTFYVELFWR